MTVSLIVGGNGQDGRIACELLKARGHNVYTLGKTGGILKYNECVFDYKATLSNQTSISNAITKLQPDEIYYFAAYSQSSEERNQVNANTFRYSQEVHVTGLFYILETIRKNLPTTKILYASSSLIFEGCDSNIHNEETQPSPMSIYAITKLSGQMLCGFYRKVYGLCASAVILYNHESEFRGENYLSMKIISTAIAIKNGKKDKLIIGDLEAQVDWGYARDYVKAMYMVNQLNDANDFVIASGKLHTVAEFIQVVFCNLDLDYENYVVENPMIIKTRRRPMRGDSAKVYKYTGWKPETSFVDMVNKMTSAKLIELAK